MAEISLPSERLAVQPDVRPTVSGLLAAPVYANYVRVANDANGFTLYFFAVPAELFELEAVKKQLTSATAAAARADSSAPVKVSVDLEPVVKIFLPVPLLMPIVQALLTNQQSWMKTYGPDADKK